MVCNYYSSQNGDLANYLGKLCLFNKLIRMRFKVSEDGCRVGFSPCDQSKRLQLRSNQQEAALRRQEQQLNRLKDRLTDRPRDKGPCESG